MQCHQRVVNDKYNVLSPDVREEARSDEDPDRLLRSRKSVVFFVPVPHNHTSGPDRLNDSQDPPYPKNPCLCIRFRRNIRQHMNRKTIIMEIREDLKKYIETEIIPRYDAFDRAHRRDHAFQVIARAVDMATRLGEDIETAYTAAAYHDTGLAEGRELHHEASGRIVAEADRAIDPETIVRRTVQYGQANHPELGREDQWERTIAHLHDKYGEGGYLHLWLEESPNAEPLKRLRRLMHDTERLRTIFEEAYNAETTACKP